MKLVLWTPTLMLLLSTLVSTANAASTSLCGNISVQDGTIALNDNERVLVCGSDLGGEGWKAIPVPQSILLLRSILQNQGYLSPRFERDGENLKVWHGPKSITTDLQVEGAAGVLNAQKKRKIVGYPLEPGKLNEVEAWAYGEIRHRGYACAHVDVEAQEWTGKIIAKTKLDSKKRFGRMNVGLLDGLSPDVLDRYRPFNEGDVYDVHLTQLMASRLLTDSLFQSAYFTVNCRGDEADLNLETSIGKPKIFRFGIGASTEELPFTDASFKNARLDNKASSFTIVLHGSPRKSSFTLGSELYWIPETTRSFLGPRFEIAKRSETSFELNTITGGVDIGRNWDALGIRFSGRWGPTLNYSKRVHGVGPEEVFYPTIDASFSAFSHVYEASIRDQFEGWSAQFFYRGQNKGLGSTLDVNRYRLDFKNLWNVGGFAPPLFVVGMRLEGTAVDADDLTNSNRDKLPVEDRIYLGGDQNLRGFGRHSINNGNLGYLTSIYAGFELRLIAELPYRFQPFLLFDAARVGNRRYTLDRPIFASEGVGVRWASPIGTLRWSLARGHVLESDAATSGFGSQWLMFGSFGQEF